MSEVSLPDGWFTRAYAAKDQGFTHVCVYCGAGVNPVGDGDHTADCARPEEKPWKHDMRELLAAITGLEREIRRPFPEFHDAHARICARLEEADRV